MKIESVSVEDFKRFHSLKIEGIPPSTRLVILAGPNGNGKSSLFDAFLKFLKGYGHRGWGEDKEYDSRSDVSSPKHIQERIRINFHDITFPGTSSQDAALTTKARKCLYIRSAFRNEPNLNKNSLQRPNLAYNEFDLPRLSENNSSLTKNYNRFIFQLISRKDRNNNNIDPKTTLEQFDREMIGAIAEPFHRILPSVQFLGISDPKNSSDFEFSKGNQKRYSYQNLSGGEKAVFEILLDLAVKTREFDDTVFCIDEPEAHLNPKVQGALLKEMLGLIGGNSQLWIATHAIGMLRAARDIEKASPGSTAILDFDQDFDQPQVLKPIKMSRAFWQKSLDVAMDDLAALVVPATLIACESSVNGQPGDGYDAQIYNKIFEEEFPDARFVSVGSCTNLTGTNFAVAQALLRTANGTTVQRLRDRDQMTDGQVSAFRDEGIRVLSVRNLEGYMFDDEVLELLCDQHGQPDKKEALKVKKGEAVGRSVGAGHSTDDLKKSAQGIHQACISVLGLTKAGTDKKAFMRDFLAQLIKPGTHVYARMKTDIFE